MPAHLDVESQRLRSHTRVTGEHAIHKVTPTADNRHASDTGTVTHVQHTMMPARRFCGQQQQQQRRPERANASRMNDDVDESMMSLYCDTPHHTALPGAEMAASHFHGNRSLHTGLLPCSFRRRLSLLAPVHRHAPCCA
jgi:hypothetical protein